MPANGRWDLIRRLKVKRTYHATGVSKRPARRNTKCLKLRTYKIIVVPVLKNRDQVAILLSEITQKQHPQRNFNHFRRITRKSKRFPLLYSVHSIRAAAFSCALHC